MQITLGTMTRGAGKIFIDAMLSEPLGANHVEVRSRTREGAELPAVTVVAGATEVVVVIPVLKVTQEVTLSVLDDSGATVATVGQSVGHLASASASKLNTLKHDVVANRIRNIDDAPFFPGTFVKVEEVIRDRGEDVVHGTVEIYPTTGPDLADALDVVLLDAEGNKINPAGWVCLSDGDQLSSSFPESRVRAIGFSARVPATVPSFVVWAKFSDKSVPDGLFAMQPRSLADRRGGWADLSRRADTDGGYDGWFRHNQQCGTREIEMQRGCHFEDGPLFSVIVPLYRTPLDLFHEMVDSVLAQTYANFELLLVDASPEDAGLAAALDTYAASDARVRRVDVEKNLGITQNTNRGIEAAKGDFLCFLDHDDVIEPDALFAYAKAIGSHPTTDLLYSDEDKLKDGVYVDPFFKPDFDIDLLCCENYVCHFLCARRSVVLSMPLATSEMDGSQDHDLTLRVAERARNVFHVRKMLYHWRIHEGSTAGSSDDKPYALVAGRLAVERHLERCGIAAEATYSDRVQMRYEVRYQMPDSEPKVSIVIPNKDGVHLLDRCVTSIIQKSTYKNYEIVIVENNSTDPRTFEFYDQLCARDDRVRVVTYADAVGFNYAAIMNFGVMQTTGEYLLLLNNDTEVIAPDWIESMMGPCMRTDVGAVGARLLFPDDTVQHAGVYMCLFGPDHIGRYLSRADVGYKQFLVLTHQVMAVTGACLLTKRALFDQLGGLDDSFEVDYNDIDFCLRLRELGLGIVYEPKAELYHYESVTRGLNVGAAKAMRFRREVGYFAVRWPQYFEKGDPFYNRNLAQSPYWHLS